MSSSTAGGQPERGIAIASVVLLGLGLAAVIVGDRVVVGDPTPPLSSVLIGVGAAAFFIGVLLLMLSLVIRAARWIARSMGP